MLIGGAFSVADRDIDCHYSSQSHPVPVPAPFMTLGIKSDIQRTSSRSSHRHSALSLWSSQTRCDAYHESARIWNIPEFHTVQQLDFLTQFPGQFQRVTPVTRTRISNTFTHVSLNATSKKKLNITKVRTSIRWEGKRASIGERGHDKEQEVRED